MTKVKSDACDLFIEQQIKEGIEEGKSGHAIAKDIVAWWNEKHGEKLSSDAIRMRVYRLGNKDGTIVPSEELMKNIEEKRKQWLKFRRAIRRSLKILTDLDGLDAGRVRGFSSALRGIDQWCTDYLNKKGREYDKEKKQKRGQTKVAKNG